MTKGKRICIIGAGPAGYVAASRQDVDATTEAAALVAHLEKVKHPALSMDPLV